MRIGYKGKTSIKRNFPDIVEKVVAHRKEVRKEKFIEIQTALRNALEESPPSSMQAICRRLGYEASTLYTKYPTECHQIAARYNIYFRERAAKRKEQLCEQVKRIVLDLHSKGIDPTASRVGNYLDSANAIRTDAFREILQALRNELNLP